MAKKSNLKPANSFIYLGYVSPEYFCDRTEETEELIANLRNGRNTTLISPGIRVIIANGERENILINLMEKTKPLILNSSHATS